MAFGFSRVSPNFLQKTVLPCCWLKPETQFAHVAPLFLLLVSAPLQPPGHISRLVISISETQLQSTSPSPLPDGPYLIYGSLRIVRFQSPSNLSTQLLQMNHTTLSLNSLQWLPFSLRIKSQLFASAFKGLQERCHLLQYPVRSAAPASSCWIIPNPLQHFLPPHLQGPSLGPLSSFLVDWPRGAFRSLDPRSPPGGGGDTSPPTPSIPLAPLPSAYRTLSTTSEFSSHVALFTV